MSRTWMPIFWGDYLRDTRDLTTLQHGAYFLLIGHYWQHNSLPQDESQLAAIAGLPLKEWKKIQGPIAAKFQEGWKHKRIEAELETAERKWLQRVQAGKRGGQKAAVARAVAIGKGIAHGQALATSSGRPSAQAVRQQPLKPPATNHKDIDSSYSEAAREAQPVDSLGKPEKSEQLDGSLATAPLGGALRSPSRIPVSPQLAANVQERGWTPPPGGLITAARPKTTQS